MKAFDRYGEVLRKKGIVRMPQPKDPNYFSPWHPKPKITPGPGHGSIL